MRYVYRVLGLTVVIGLVAGIVFLMTWDIPAPTAPVEKILPDDRFPR